MRTLFSICLFVLCGASYAATVGGNIAPDGRQIHNDLPEDLHRRNTSSRGQGCCVFTSIHHAALWQDVPALHEFPKWLQAKGLPGGGYPGNVKERITKICKERGVPEPAYIQVEGRDLEILKLACRSGRIPAVTYMRSPTGRYGGSGIAHMVSMPHCDEKYVGILDNNYIHSIEWMSPDEYLRVCNGGRDYWAVILLDAGPPPAPEN